MNRRQVLKLSGMALVAHGALSQDPKGQGSRQAEAPSGSLPALPNGQGSQQAEYPPGSLPTVQLKDYRPVSLYKTQVTVIKKARHPVFDIHCHGARNFETVGDMVKLMDSLNIEKTVILTGASTPKSFAEMVKPYAIYRDRFEMWCKFDSTGIDQPGYGPAAVKSLEDCYQLGAKGVGELDDRGRGIGATGKGAGNRAGAHSDDSRMDALWNRCGSLGMPVTIHLGDPIWGYAPQDKYNEGGMYAWKVKADLQPGMYNHQQVLDSFENALKKHRQTTFIACHLANLEYDLAYLGGMLDRNPNLFTDISWKSVEIATIPRAMNEFLRKYPDRVFYGTDHDYAQSFLTQVFHIIESSDEHFYVKYGMDCGHSAQSCIPELIYTWPLSGLDLPDDMLKKLYRDNAVAVFRRAQKVS